MYLGLFQWMQLLAFCIPSENAVGVSKVLHHRSYILGCKTLYISMINWGEVCIIWETQMPPLVQAEETQPREKPLFKDHIPKALT